MRWITKACAAKLAGAVGLIALFFMGVHATSGPRPVHFATAEAAKQFFMSHGLHCHLGTVNAPTLNSFYVADHPITFDDTLAVAFRRNCGLTPEWKGILWIAQLDNSSLETVLHPASVDGKWRVWGNVLVAGDEDLMDRIETRFRD